MYDDYITRFRNKVTVEDDVSAKVNDIIALSLSKMSVMLERLQKAIPVIFINKNKEGGDESIMYSYTTDGVQVGDYVTAFDKSHLVYKEISNLKREDYIDCWNTVMCNISFTFNSSTIKGYFRGGLRSIGSDEENLAQSFGIDSKGESFIIIPSSILLKPVDIISINNKGWKVTSRDDITNSGIAYISLEEYNIPDLNKVSEVAAIDYVAPEIDYLKVGSEYTFTTEDGYFISNPRVQILQKTLTSITFKVPFGISSIQLTVKELGVIKATTYEVRS